MMDPECASEIQRYKDALDAIQNQLAEKEAEVRHMERYFKAARYVAHHTAFRYGFNTSKIDEMISRKFDEYNQEETTNGKRQIDPT